MIKTNRKFSKTRKYKNSIRRKSLKQRGGNSGGISPSRARRIMERMRTLNFRGNPYTDPLAAPRQPRPTDSGLSRAAGRIVLKKFAEYKTGFIKQPSKTPKHP